MKKRKGFTLIEIMLSFLLLSIIAIIFITCITSVYSFLRRSKTYTEATFSAVDDMESLLMQMRKSYDTIVEDTIAAGAPYLLADTDFEAAYPSVDKYGEVSYFEGFCTDRLNNYGSGGTHDNDYIPISIHTTPKTLKINVESSDYSGSFTQSYLATFAAEYQKNFIYVPLLEKIEFAFSAPAIAGVYSGEVTTYSTVDGGVNPIFTISARSYFPPDDYVINPDGDELTDEVLYNNVAAITYYWYETNKNGFFIPGRNGMDHTNDVPGSLDYEGAFPSWSDNDFTLIRYSKLFLNEDAIFMGTGRDPNPANPIGVTYDYIGKHLMCVASVGAFSGKIAEPKQGPAILVSGFPVFVAAPQPAEAKYRAAPSRLPLFTHLDACMIDPQDHFVAPNPMAIPPVIGVDPDITADVTWDIDGVFVNRWINISDDAIDKDATRDGLPADRTLPPNPLISLDSRPTLQTYPFNDDISLGGTKEPTAADPTRHVAQYVSFDVSAVDAGGVPTTEDERQRLSFSPGNVVNGVATNFDPNNCTMFVVARSNGVAGNNDTRVLSAFDIATNDYWELRMQSFTMDNIAGDHAEVSHTIGTNIGEVEPTEWQLLFVNINAGQPTFLVNGNLPANDTAIAAPVSAGASQIYIGYNPHEPGTFSGVDVAEIIICNGSLSDPNQIFNINKYLADKYKLSINNP